MSFFDPDKIYKQTEYQHRLMLCLMFSLIIMILIFKLWPHLVTENTDKVYIEPTQEIFVEQSIATKQETTPASPPKPQIPVPVPTDEVIEEDIELLDFEDMLSLEKLGEGEVGQTGDSDQPVASPQRSPTPLKIIEPATPEEARNAEVIAEVYVTFLVDKKGIVEEIFISSIRKYEKNARDYEIVQQIGYGIMGASLTAAKKWRFNPAIDNGKPVKAYTTQVFSFGF
ncbi:MAG: energy transducer TonB [Balneola sp.]